MLPRSRPRSCRSFRGVYAISPRADWRCGFSASPRETDRHEAQPVAGLAAPTRPKKQPQNLRCACMSTASIQLSAGLAGLRAALGTYREQVVLGRADPRFAAAREKSARIGGYTAPAELCLLYHLAVAARGRGRIVEIGSYLGRSTIVLASACADERRAPGRAGGPRTAPRGSQGRPARATA